MNELSRSEPRRRGRWTLIALLALFLGPIMAAWLLNVESPAWLPVARSNHGQLFQPPALFPLAYLKTIESEPASSSLLQGKWTLIYLEQSDCSSACERAIYRMRQVRHAMGKDMQRIQPLLVSSMENVRSAHYKIQQYDSSMVIVAAGPRWFEHARFLERDAEIYLVDPQGYLVLSYLKDADPSGLIEDLKRLLKISKIG